jgi:hypothetical protein
MAGHQYERESKQLIAMILLTVMMNVFGGSNSTDLRRTRDTLESRIHRHSIQRAHRANGDGLWRRMQVKNKLMFDEERSMSKIENDEEERGQRRVDHKCDSQQSPQHRKDPKKPRHC